MINVSFRYNGEPDERLYGLKASLTNHEMKSLAFLEATARDIAQEIIDEVRANWSEDSPARAGQPPAIDSGNLDTSGFVLYRDVSGRFTSAKNAKAATVLWDTRRGKRYHGRGEYAAVQEYGLDGLKAAHPFLQPAVNSVMGEYYKRIRKGL